MTESDEWVAPEGFYNTYTLKTPICDWCEKSAPLDSSGYVSLFIFPSNIETIHTDGRLCLNCSMDLKRVIRSKTFRDHINSCIGLAFAHGVKYNSDEDFS